jgi:hypothetical protein
MVKSLSYTITVSLISLLLCSSAEALKGRQPRQLTFLDLERISQERELQSKNNGGGRPNSTNKKSSTPQPTVIELPTESPAPSPSPTAAPSRSFNPTHAGAPLPPTSTPSEEPTTLSPSSLPPTTSTPSELPTAPSSFPSTLSPSFFPTAPPSVTGLVGFINVSFSLLAEGVTTKSIVRGKQTKLIANVTDALLRCLCQETNFVFLDDKNNLDSCQDQQIHRLLVDNTGAKVIFDGDSILRPDQVEFILSDRSKEEFQYTEWMVEYPVIQIGNNYLDASKDPLHTMQAHAQKAVNSQLNKGLLWDPALFGSRMAVVGQEVETWRYPIFTYYKALNPAPFHTLRVAGIILLILSASVTYFITSLAKQRRIEREWEAEFKERGKGGLQTEEGVLHMLETGRNNAAESAAGSQIKLGKLLGSIKSNISDEDEDAFGAVAAAVLDTNYQGAMEMEQSYELRPSN